MRNLLLLKLLIPLETEWLVITAAGPITKIS